MNLLGKILKWGKLGTTRLLFLASGGVCRSRLFSGGGGYTAWCTTFALVTLSDEIFIIHASLYNQKTSCYERLFEELALEHFHEMFDADIRFLFICGRLYRWLATCRLLLLQSEKLLLLLDADLVAFF